MHPLLLLLLGMAIVVGGILWLRLPAFVALLLAALVVGWGADPRAGTRYLRDSLAGRVIRSESEQAVWIQPPRQLAARPGMLLWGYEARTLGLAEGASPTAELVLVRKAAADEAAPPESWLARVVRGRAAAGMRVVYPSQWQQTAQATRRGVAQRVAEALGGTCGRIGLLIAMASLIGRAMLESGAADRIVRALLAGLGEARAALAFLAGGFLLGIPVFFDTVFYLMIPLGKALGARRPQKYLLYVLTIVAGGTMAHSLVPPTPGPLMVAEELGVDLGTMILAGCIVGAFSAAYGYWHAHWANRRWQVPLRETAEMPQELIERFQQASSDQLPPLWVSLLPILLPVVLLAGASILRNFAAAEMPRWLRALYQAVQVLGEKNLALVLAAALAVGVWVFWQRPGRSRFQQSLQTALAGAGMIILITSAGGAFGAMLQQSGIAHWVRQTAPRAQAWLLLPLAFGITTLVRTAQGSATVAMITAVGIVSAMVAGQPLPYHRVYLALAIGAGSKPVAWMNDSGFWVICRMSGMTESETLKTLTPMTAMMGLVALAVTMLGAWLVPLAG